MTEAALVAFFEDCNRAAIHRGIVTIMNKDVCYVRDYWHKRPGVVAIGGQSRKNGDD